MNRAIILATLLALQGCVAIGPGLLATLTTIGSVAATIGTTEQLGITGITDWLAFKKQPVGVCAVPPPVTLSKVIDGAGN